MYPPNPMLDRRIAAIFGAAQPPIPQMPQRAGATPPLGGLPSVITPDQIGSEALNDPYAEDYDVAARLQELYQPQRAASDRLNQILGQYPQRKEPGILAKIVGSLAGGARGPDAADRVMYGGHYRDVMDWENQVKPLEYAANQERYDNQNNRALSIGTANQERYDRRLQFDERKRQDKEHIDNEKLLVSQKRAAAYDFKARNPNMVIKVDQNTGNLVGINPQTGKPTYITDSNGKAISGRDLSFEDRQNILQENRLEAIDRAGEVGLNRVQVAGDESRITKRSPSYDDLNPSANDPKQDSPSEARTRRTYNAETILDEHPEWADYITFDGNRVIISPDTPAEVRARIKLKLNAPKIHPNTTRLIGRAKEGEVRDYASPGGQATPGKKLGTAQPNINPRYQGPPIKNPDDRVTVISPDGTKGSIPREQLERALAKGFKVQ